MRRALAVAALCALALLLMSCSNADADGLKDGYYTAEAAEFDDYGWKEYISIYVSSGRIVTVEYNAKNASGFVKSWDMNYMRTMNAVSGTYPNKYTREYAAELLNRQDYRGIDAISGATHSHDSFMVLAESVISKAKAGDKSVTFVN